MSDTDQMKDWDQRCRAEGVDPNEVRLVLGRYEAYRRFYETSRRAQPLALDAWFRWYRVEAMTETGQKAPPPGGCSIDDDALHRGTIGNPGTFLGMLEELARLRAVAPAGS
jgi:hypothetical protein